MRSFLLLWDANASKNPEFTVTVYPKFNLDEKDVAEVKAEFRFQKNDRPLLYEVLGIQDIFRGQQRRLSSDWLIFRMRISAHFFEAIGEEALFQLEGVKLFSLTSC